MEHNSAFQLDDYLVGPHQRCHYSVLPYLQRQDWGVKWPSL